MRTLVHVQDEKIARDDELTHLNWDILQNAYRSPGGAISQLTGYGGADEFQRPQLLVEGEGH